MRQTTLALLAFCLATNLSGAELQPHFPDAVHAYVWRNWGLVPGERMARVIGASAGDVLRMGNAMGLADPPAIPAMQQQRSYLTIIKRNWHLLSYEQLLATLDWKKEQFEDLLREDIAFPASLGGRAPIGNTLKYQPPGTAALEREKQIAAIVRKEFPDGAGRTPDPLFAFIARLSEPPTTAAPQRGDAKPLFSPRYCYSYFAPYGDFSKEMDPFPDGYLARLAQSGVDGVWLVGRMDKLAPFPWEPKPVLTSIVEENLQNLRALVVRAAKQKIGVYLYLNEPRAMPLAFFATHPELKGVVEGNFAALCTGTPEVKKYVTESIAHICKGVPELAGIFTISGSENLTHCWSHNHGGTCPRCAQRGAEVFAEANTLIRDGIRQSGTKVELIIWDWGWPDAWAEQIINGLPGDASFMSVSEWNMKINRGGIESIVGEYSISAVGPGPRAAKNWEIARKHGMKTIAKIQANNTWELSTVPYIPAVENVARHAANLRAAGVNGLMLGWTLGGCPSPNLDVVAEIGSATNLTPGEAMNRVAIRRFGAAPAPAVVRAWKSFSAAFSEFPFQIQIVYDAPLQVGPANLLWEKPTGRRATMAGFPYDDLNSWRANFPAPVYIAQFNKMADGFEQGIAACRAEVPDAAMTPALREELNVAEAAAIHFRSVANQARFVIARDALAAAKTDGDATPLIAELERVLQDEISLSRRLYAIQALDSRIGFEAANQYFYVPLDLAEKVLNCRDLLDRWLPAQRRKP